MVKNASQFLISTDLTLNCSHSDSYALISDSDGFMVAYRCYTLDGLFGIFANIFDENGVVIGDLITVKDFSDFDSNPAVTGLYNGNFVVAWRDDAHINAKWYNSDGTL